MFCGRSWIVHLLSAFKGARPDKRSLRQPVGKMLRDPFIHIRETAPLSAAHQHKDTNMHTFLNNQKALAKDERGVTALEYGLIAGLVAAVIVTSVTALGTKLTGTFGTIAAALH
jgi:pilus assembly protein Flp/PilA